MLLAAELLSGAVFASFPPDKYERASYFVYQVMVLRTVHHFVGFLQKKKRWAENYPIVAVDPLSCS